MVNVLTQKKKKTSMRRGRKEKESKKPGRETGSVVHELQGLIKK